MLLGCVSQALVCWALVMDPSQVMDLEERKESKKRDFSGNFIFDGDLSG